MTYLHTEYTRFKNDSGHLVSEAGGDESNRVIQTVMANLKAVLRKTDLNSQDKGKIKIRLSHKGRVGYLSTDFSVFYTQFDHKRGEVAGIHPNRYHINIELRKQINELDLEIIRLGARVNSMTASQLVSHLAQKGKNTDFFHLFDTHIAELEREGRARTAALYRSTRNALEKYLDAAALDIENIDYVFLKAFEIDLREKGRMQNSIASHMQNIRSVYNKAIRTGKIGYENYPFRTYVCRPERTMKRNLRAEDIAGIAGLSLPDRYQEEARDMFMLSFYLRGINMIDLLNLKPGDVSAGRIQYRRSKTRQLLSVKIEPEAQEIIDRYSGEKHLLRFLDREVRCESVTTTIIRNLRKIAVIYNINKGELTTYYARYSWATIASDLGVSRDVIAHALGQRVNSITDWDIDFDQRKVDAANRRIIDHINGISANLPHVTGK